MNPKIVEIVASAMLMICGSLWLLVVGFEIIESTPVAAILVSLLWVSVPGGVLVVVGLAGLASVGRRD